MSSALFWEGAREDLWQQSSPVAEVVRVVGPRNAKLSGQSRKRREGLTNFSPLHTTWNANYATRLRFLGLAYCVHVEPKILRTVMSKCPNLVVLDVTGIVRESQESMTELRATDKESELLMRRNELVKERGEDRDPREGKQWRNDQDVAVFFGRRRGRLGGDHVARGGCC